MNHPLFFRFALHSLVLAFACGCLPSIFADESTGPEKWEKDIAAMKIRDSEFPPKEGAMLFVGSSSIRLWDLGTSWPDVATINNWFGGSTLPDAIFHFDRLFKPYKPSAIIIYSGENDMNKGASPQTVADSFKKLTDLIALAHPGIQVFYISMKPSVARWKIWPEIQKGNAAIAEICKSEDHLHFIDIAPVMLGETGAAPSADWFKEDGLHLLPHRYEAWTEVINAHLRESGILK